MNQDHRQLSDQDFINQLENECLDPELFSHEAHLRAAWLYLNRTDAANAIACISKVIRAMDPSGTKYHHTITVAFALLILIEMRQNPADSWEECFAANPGLCTGKRLLSSFYSDDILANGLSRSVFIPPNKTRHNPEELLTFFNSTESR
jgi:hypothetical protein